MEWMALVWLDSMAPVLVFLVEVMYLSHLVLDHLYLVLDLVPSPYPHELAVTLLLEWLRT